MKSRFSALAIVVIVAALSANVAEQALAGGNHRARRQNACGSEWAGGYYHTMWDQPVALLVPPTAELQTHWNWGVAQTSVTPIWPQFTRAYPGPYYGGRGFLPTPRWPNSTDQFGVYYARGPW